MAQLTTVADYIAEARRLLQDQQATFRYPDLDMIEALNHGIMEAFRLRPDFFVAAASAFSAPPDLTNTSSNVGFPLGYRHALLSYLVGKMLLRDAEPANDARANALMSRFTAQLLTLVA